MKYKETILIILSVMVFQSISKEPEVNLCGVWLDSNYIARTKATLSPKAAFLPSLSLVAIQIETKHKSINFSYDFHQQLSGKYINVDNNNNIVPAYPPWPENINAIRIKNGNIILIKKDSTGIHTNVFIKVSSDTGNITNIVSHLIGSWTIKGEYKDSNNLKYSFNAKDGVWNGKPFKYSIEVDFVEFCPMDMLCIEDSIGQCNEAYFFVTNGAFMQLYKYDDDNRSIGKLILSVYKE
jgi:hypothetical protein